MVATSCGKLILLGEHAVVYGEPALAVPLHDLRLSVVLSAGERPHRTGRDVLEPPSDELPGTGRSEAFPITDFRDTAVFPVVESSDLAMVDDDDPEGASGEFSPVSELAEASSAPASRLQESRTMDLAGPPPLSVDVGDDAPDGAERDVARALAACAKSLGLPVPLPVRLAVRSGGLRSGMGTSAALGVALARALLLFYGQQPSLPSVLRAAEAVERLFHGNPSGVDHTVAAGERPVWFVKGKAPRQLGKLCAVDLVIRPGQSAESTAEVVTGVRERLADDPTLARVIADIGRRTREGRVAWTKGNLDLLAASMTAQQSELDRLGVVLDKDREGIARALDAGAMASKITGAGRGGSLFALVAPGRVDSVLEAWGPGAIHARVGGT